MADTRPLHSQPADHAQWAREFEAQTRLRGDPVNHGETFHLTKSSKIILGLGWSVMMAASSLILGFTVKMYDRQSDWIGVTATIVNEQKQLEKEQQRQHDHIVSVDTFAHESAQQLNRRIDEALREQPSGARGRK